MTYPVNMEFHPEVDAFFDEATNTISYIVKAPDSDACAVIDSVMDIDYAAGRITSEHADELVADIDGGSPKASYDGYGSCPLTVERGKIVLAEFGYGGVLKPSFPAFLLDGGKATRAAWFLKEKMLPPIYWNAMLRGREWLARPEALKVAAK